MKNIIKKSVFVFTMVAIFVFGTNTVLAAMPTIVTNSATLICSTSAMLNGAFDDAPTNTWFEYGTSQAQVSSGSGIMVGSTPQNISTNLISFSLNGLTPSSNYYFRTVGFNGSGTSYGSVLSLATSASGCGGGSSGGGGGGLIYLPISSTQNATGVMIDSATLNGSVNPNGYATNAWFEYGTSSILTTTTATAHIAQGSVNSSSTLIQTITGLTPNTTYYFRTVASNSFGPSNGNVSSFTTASIPVVVVTPPTQTPTTQINAPTGVITTVQATNQTATSAKLNGIFINENNSAAAGYFQYGTTSSFGSTTVNKTLGTLSSVSFSDTISGLVPNTIYYFRAVTVKQNQTYNGRIMVFETKGVINNNIQTDTTNTTVTPDTTLDTDSVTEAQSSVLQIINAKDIVSTGDEVNYLITFKNTDSKNFENSKIIIQLPKEIDFNESNFGKQGSDNTVTFEPGILVPNQISSFTVKGKVNSKAEDKSILVTTAVMSYNLTGSTTEKDEISYATNHVVLGIGLAANSVFGTSFLPSTLLGWLALMLVILALVTVSRKIFGSYFIKTTGIKNTDHIDNLPI